VFSDRPTVVRISSSGLRCAERDPPYCHPLRRGIQLNVHKPDTQTRKMKGPGPALYDTAIRAFLYYCTVIRLSSARMWRRVVWWKCSNISDEMTAVIPKLPGFLEMSVYLWLTARRHKPEHSILLEPPPCESGTRECRTLMRKHMGKYNFLRVGYIMSDRKLRYSYEPLNDVSVTDTQHIWRWTNKIILL
jgi:hypothetical protein